MGSKVVIHLRKAKNFYVRGGKRYKADQWYSSKYEALHDAKIARKQGYNASVFAVKAAGKNKNYALGIRTKRK